MPEVNAMMDAENTYQNRISIIKFTGEKFIGGGFLMNAKPIGQNPRGHPARYLMSGRYPLEMA